MLSDRQSIDRGQGLSSEQQVARRRHVRLVGQVEVAHDFASIPQCLRQVEPPRNLSRLVRLRMDP